MFRLSSTCTNMELWLRQRDKSGATLCIKFLNCSSNEEHSILHSLASEQTYLKETKWQLGLEAVPSSSKEMIKAAMREKFHVWIRWSALHLLFCARQTLLSSSTWCHALWERGNTAEHECLTGSSWRPTAGSTDYTTFSQLLFQSQANCLPALFL